MALTKSQRRRRIKLRVRRKIRGTAERPRLSVYRSNKGIYCQIIDDINGTTLVSANYRDASIPQGLDKKEQAKKVGQLIGEKAKEHQIENVVFDRSGYLYHGRVKALAEGAREKGLNI